MIVGVTNPLKPIEDALTWLLEHLHADTGMPWAWSIIALTLIVRVLLVPLMVRQIHSMQSLQRHAPEMKAIQARHKGDRQKMNEELMKFYKENGINPAASCLPMLLQLPVFFSLYFVLRDFKTEVYDQYPASDLHWLGFIPDVTSSINAHWTGYLLVVIYVVSQVSSTYFMSNTMDKTQRILFMALPIIFVPFILNPPGKTIFPVGLLMYWMTTNLWTIGQGLITRRLIPKAEPPPKRSSRTPPKEPSGDGAQAAADKPKPSPARAGQTKRVKRKKKARR